MVVTSECRRRRRLRSPFGMSAIIAALTGKGKVVGRPGRRWIRASAIPEGSAPSSVCVRGVCVRSASLRSLGSFAFAVAASCSACVPDRGQGRASRRCLRLGGIVPGFVPALQRQRQRLGSAAGRRAARCPANARAQNSTPDTAGVFGSSSRGGSDVNSSSFHTLTHAMKSLVLGFCS